MYQIYKILSPSGKFYIGLTSQTALVRWRNHIRKAYVRPEYNHGLYNAIRKYGPAAFELTVVGVASSKQEAQRMERSAISAAPKGLLYNVSPGGEADGETGGHIFWSRLRADPDAHAAYLNRLSATKKARDWSDYGAMSASNAAWRAANPREAYYLARRGLRVAMRGVQKREEDTRTLKERLLWKHRRGSMVSKNMLKFWREASDQKKELISQRVSASVKKQWEAVIDPAERSKRTAQARAAIDRNVQKKAASSGLKQWWAALKADPEKYADYLKRRTNSLRQRGNNNANI